MQRSSLSECVYCRMANGATKWKNGMKVHIALNAQAENNSIARLAHSFAHTYSTHAATAILAPYHVGNNVCRYKPRRISIGDGTYRKYSSATAQYMARMALENNFKKRQTKQKWTKNVYTHWAAVAPSREKNVLCSLQNLCRNLNLQYRVQSALQRRDEKENLRRSGKKEKLIQTKCTCTHATHASQRTDSRDNELEKPFWSFFCCCSFSSLCFRVVEKNNLIAQYIFGFVFLLKKATLHRTLTGLFESSNFAQT